MPNSQTQTPIQETQERIAETSPLLAFPRMMQIAHQNHLNKAGRRRVEDSHRQQAAILRGEPMPEPLKPESPEEDEMGDSFSIAGDTTTTHNHYYPPPAMPPQPTAPPAAPAPASPAPVAATPTEQTTPAWKTWLARSALAAGGLAAGAGGLAGYNWLTADNEKPPAVEQPADTPQALPYTPPTIIGPGISTEKWNFLPGEQP